MTDHPPAPERPAVALAPETIQLAPEEGVRLVVTPPAVPLGPLPDPKAFLVPDMQALVQGGYRF